MKYKLPRAIPAAKRGETNLPLASANNPELVSVARQAQTNGDVSAKDLIQIRDNPIVASFREEPQCRLWSPKSTRV
jgi:hypothetical protein